MVERVAVGLLIVLILIPGTSRAQFWHCAQWNEMPDLAKVFYLTGWMEGSAIAASVITGDAKESHRFWPEGHRVGSVHIELDIACKKNPALPVSKAIGNMVNEKKQK